jgi:hypothetical protein
LNSFSVTDFSANPLYDSTYQYVHADQINSGFVRSLTFSITKYVNGVVDSVVTFDGKQAFDTYSFISNAELRAMVYADYVKRLNDYVAWFVANHAAEYPGMAAVDSSGARVLNTGLCPI